MSATITTASILILFYLAFASQVFLVSVFYPRQIAARMHYMLDHFPPSEFPKLYPGAGPDFVGATKARIGMYLGVNYAIAAFGGVALVAVVLGFHGMTVGGSKAMAAVYFIIQVMPFIYLSVVEMRRYKAMREAYSASRMRSANLSPRRLGNYIAPGYVALAVVLYVAWVVFYLSGKGPMSQWGEEVTLTLPLITFMNIMYVFVVRGFISGRRLDPLASPADQHRAIEVVVKSVVISSIGVSLFLIGVDAVDRFDLRELGAVLTSLYMQACMVMGVGMTLRRITPETMNFDVYRADNVSTAG
ncbi:MAG: hypothetical protein EP335_11290 [Alphaproteobacteria bacterium]|nr:MAG: hypothetical protein EP335_11290 [Alphaproteobacteria bacterium]